jgi:hypothetical protein
VLRHPLPDRWIHRERNSIGGPLDLNACYQREMKDVLKRVGISWHGCGMVSVEGWRPT